MVSSKSNRVLTNGRGSASAPGVMEKAGGAARLPGPACGSARAGFTIIELLSSMAILIFIVMMMTRMFAEATSIWTLGTRQITAASEGRAIMDFIVKEMTQAIADSNVTFKLNSGADSVKYGVKDVYGAECDEVCFVAMVRSGDSGYRRTGNQFVYFVTNMRDESAQVIPHRYRLVRVRRTQSMYSNAQNILKSAYHDRNWWQNMEPDWTDSGSGMPVETIAENVAAFEVWAYPEDQAGKYEPDPLYDYPANDADSQDILPLWVDIYLEILSEEDAIRAKILAESGDVSRLNEFLFRSVKRYNACVFFPNRERTLAVLP